MQCTVCAVQFTAVFSVQLLNMYLSTMNNSRQLHRPSLVPGPIDTPSGAGGHVLEGGTIGCDKVVSGTWKIMGLPNLMSPQFNYGYQGFE